MYSPGRTGNYPEEVRTDDPWCYSGASALARGDAIDSVDCRALGSAQVRLPVGVECVVPEGLDLCVVQVQDESGRLDLGRASRGQIGVAGRVLASQVEADRVALLGGIEVRRVARTHDEVDGVDHPGQTRQSSELFPGLLRLVARSLAGFLLHRLQRSPTPGLQRPLFDGRWGRRHRATTARTCVRRSRRSAPAPPWPEVASECTRQSASRRTRCRQTHGSTTVPRWHGTSILGLR